MPERHFAAAAQRNAAPILEVLRHEFTDRTTVLEIGSGTGQHAMTFAGHLTQLQWQPSDVADNCPGIQAWVDEAELDNVMQPLELDVRRDGVGDARFDAAFSANTAHIMDIDAVERMFALLGSALEPGARFCLYGPFRVAGECNTSSNAAFDMSLRQRHASMGIRDLEVLDGFARKAGMRRRRLYAMPSNNFAVLWQKGE